MNIKNIFKEYFTILKKEDIDNISSVLNNDCILYTPLNGKISGRKKIKNYFIKQKVWLNIKKAKIDMINTIDINNRMIIEFVIFYNKGTEVIELPIVAVLDIENTRTIDTVILNGRVLEREKLDAMLEAVKHANEISRKISIDRYL